MQSPPIGWRVWFFEAADTNSTPQAADVVGVSQHTMVKLALVPYHGGTIRATKFVRHVSDPVLIKRPELAHREGGWDWMPGNVYVPPGQSPAERAMTKEETRAAGKRLAEKQVRDGKRPPDIVEEVRKFGLSKSDVAKIIQDIESEEALEKVEA